MTKKKIGFLDFDDFDFLSVEKSLIPLRGNGRNFFNVKTAKRSCRNVSLLQHKFWKIWYQKNRDT